MHASDSHLRPHNALLAAALLSKSETTQDDSLRDFAASLARYPIPILHPSAAVCVCHSSVAHLDYLREAIQTVYQNTPTREEFLKQASPFRFVASDTYREWLRGEYEKSEHHHHHKDSRYVPVDFFCHGWRKKGKEGEKK
ncbi:hypothetical protein ADEAN_000734400 [Angomonas deanei]|uniref:Uncharacterized protein n=1 Tax=Angomonas deanei TaxID=59799 RepID=A0A7G2CLN3_9TRYP|nr:hypothetical protein ADEAN_000734400 [Angomonas deanei]